jgi:hypothetical protein
MVICSGLVLPLLLLRLRIISGPLLAAGLVAAALAVGEFCAPTSLRNVLSSALKDC